MISPKKKTHYLGLAATLAFVAALAISITNYRASYHVEATTEYIKVIQHKGTTVSWPIVDASIDTSDGIFSGAATLIIGSLEADITIELVRTTTNQFYINLSASQGSVGYLASDDGKVQLLPSSVTIGQNVAPLTAHLGGPTTYQVVGTISIGSSHAAIDGYAPSLLSGQVVVRGHASFSNTLYSTDTSDLSLGDVVHIVDTSTSRQTIGSVTTATTDTKRPAAFGFVRIDKKMPAMRVVIDQVADYAQVQRFQTQGYTISLTWFDKIMHDTTLQAFWATFVFLAVLYTQLLDRRKEDR